MISNAGHKGYVIIIIIITYHSVSIVVVVVVVVVVAASASLIIIIIIIIIITTYFQVFQQSRYMSWVGHPHMGEGWIREHRGLVGMGERGSRLFYQQAEKQIEPFFFKIVIALFTNTVKKYRFGKYVNIFTFTIAENTKCRILT